MDGTTVTTSANTPSQHAAATQPNYAAQRHQLSAQSLPPLQPGLDYYCENQAYSADHRQNYLLMSAISHPYATAAAAAAAAAAASTTCANDNKGDDSYVYYQLTNNVHSYRWYVPKIAPQLQPAAFAHKAATRSSRNHQQLQAQLQQQQHHQQHHQQQQQLQQQQQPLQQQQQQRFLDEWSPPAHKERGDGETAADTDKESGLELRTKLSSKMHPVQLLHQIFRKEAFVMEYERINDGPFSRVRVTYKVNGRAYVAEATRLKEARRLCAKQVLRDQFPHLQIESDDDIPRAEYDVSRFDNKHPVQILYQIFRYEPMEMHCEEEGAAHFAKHIFTFVIRGTQYQAKAETIKEAKRRAAILALNQYFKRAEARTPPTVVAAAMQSAPSTGHSAPSTSDSAPIQHVLAPPMATTADEICAT